MGGFYYLRLGKLKNHFMENEEWKFLNLKGLERYQVSNLGRVKSPIKGGKIMSGHRMHDKGYPIIRLTNTDKVEKTFFVHRLIALTFIPNPNKYPQINHIDCNKQNNNVINLEWCTNEMNVKHAIESGITWGLKGEENPRAKLTEDDVFKIRDLFALGKTRRQLAEQFNTKPSNIKDIVLRRSWRHI